MKRVEQYNNSVHRQGRMYRCVQSNCPFFSLCSIELSIHEHSMHLLNRKSVRYYCCCTDRYIAVPGECLTPPSFAVRTRPLPHSPGLLPIADHACCDRWRCSFPTPKSCRCCCFLTPTLVQNLESVVTQRKVLEP